MKQQIVAYVELYEDSQRLADPIVLVLPSGEPRQAGRTKREQTAQRMMQCTEVNNIYYEHGETNAKVDSLIKIAKEMRAFTEENDRSRSDGENETKRFMRIYGAMYAEEIDAIVQCLTSLVDFTRRGSILVHSYGNNGKTALFHFLSALHPNLHMLYVDVGELQSSTYTIGDLTLYLETVFQEFSGPLIFLDNLDRLCYEIDEGDLHRQNERIISSAISKKICKYARLYEKSIIITAKNINHIDKEFLKDCEDMLQTQLKNPSLEQRNRVLKKFYGDIS